MVWCGGPVYGVLYVYMIYMSVVHASVQICIPMHVYMEVRGEHLVSPSMALLLIPWDKVSNWTRILLFKQAG